MSGSAGIDEGKQLPLERRDQSSFVSRAFSSARLLAVRCAGATLPVGGGSIAVSSSLTTRLYGRLHSSLPSMPALPPENLTHSVPVQRPAADTVGMLSRVAYEKAGVEIHGPFGGESGRQTRQRHTGGRVPGGGRPTGTRRDTLRTLRSGMTRAACAAVVTGGFEIYMRCLSVSLLNEQRQTVCVELRDRAAEYYRGEVWPLRHAFGMLSRFVNGTSDGSGKVLTPAVVTTWLGEGGDISCSCVGRASYVGRRRAALSSSRTSVPPRPPLNLGPPPAVLPSAASAEDGGDSAAADPGVSMAASGQTPGHPHGSGFAGQAGVPAEARDAVCIHARTLRRAIRWLCKRMKVPVSTFRARVPTNFASESVRPSEYGTRSGAAVEDWDAEVPMEVFRTGQSAVAVVVSGLGSCKLVCPVRCTRRVTSFSFCDNADAFACIHAVRKRSVRRVDALKPGAAGERKDDVGVDGARWRLRIPLYNFPGSACVNTQVRWLLQEGKPFLVKTPAACPHGNTAATPPPLRCTRGR